MVRTLDGNDVYSSVAYTCSGQLSLLPIGRQMSNGLLYQYWEDGSTSGAENVQLKHAEQLIEPHCRYQ